MRKFARIRWVLAAVGAGLLAVATAPQIASAHGPSTGGAGIDSVWQLFNITLLMAIPIFLLVEGLIIFAVLRYRRKHADEMPEQVHGNTALEITWTVLAFAIITVLFVLTLRALDTDYRAEADQETTPPDYSINVIGYTFNWDYEYFIGENEATGVRTTKRVTVPADRNVLLRISSRDVQHSFWVPELAGKVDAVPGYTNTQWLRVKEPGLYTGNCAEYCGLLHYDMLIELEALPPAEFDRWLADKMAGSADFVPIGTDLDSELPAGDAASGEGIFHELGCDNCHGPQDGAGPALPGMGQRAVEHGEAAGGLSAEQYLRDSILVPCDYEVPGFHCQVMPSDYGQKLDAQALADLIAYLQSQ
ncbi:MAG TPA: cytochrome c oxidase subunit II [Aggregatilineaceae bacterium]|nr:cytochrome c oxidase subunit II [Anaerolineae bacterium]HMM29482.1 cytochrome c oxidase subunit II [Aggregatilineaceae bacterium]